MNAFGYYRGTFNLKLVVNGSPFATGRVLLLSSPYEGELEVDRQINISSVSCLTSYPHIEADIGSGETPTLSIPYCGETPWSLTGPGDVLNQWSYARIVMLNPLQGPTNGETAQLQVYGWLSDLELSIPVAESSESGQKTDSVISSTLNSVSKVAGSMGDLPLIGSVAKDVGWTAGLASKVAGAFGFSRPLTDLSVRPIANVPAMGYTNCENVDNSVVLGLRPSNAVTNTPEINFSRIDPLQTSHFLSRDQVIDQIPYSSVAVSNTVLSSYILSDDLISNSLFRYISHHYVFWRGGLVFRLSKVGNAFYSGRVSIEYQASGNIPGAFTPDVPGIIWDIRTDKEIYFSIPFVSLTRMRASGQRIGILVIRVINPLKVQDTMPSTIDLNLSLCPAADVSFAVPQSMDLALAQSGDTLANPTPGVMEPSSLRKKAFPLLDLPLTTHENETMVMGEPSVSLNDLIKRFCFVTTSLTTAFSLDPLYMGNIGAKVPLFTLSRVFRFHRGSIRYKLRQSMPPSTNTGVFSTEPVFLNVQLKKSFGPNITPPAQVDSVPPLDALPTHYQRMDLNPVFEFSIPYFNVVDRVYNSETNKSAQANSMVATV